MSHLFTSALPSEKQSLDSGPKFLSPPSSYPRENIETLHPVETRGNFRRFPYSYTARSEIEECKKKIFENFDKIIQHSKSEDPIKHHAKDFKFFLSKLDPHNLEFLADSYFNKLIGNSCNSQEYDFSAIYYLIKDHKSPLIKSFVDRLKLKFNELFQNSTKKSIKEKFLQVQHNDFFSELINTELSKTFNESSIDQSRVGLSVSSINENTPIDTTLNEIQDFIFSISDKFSDSDFKKCKIYSATLLDLVIDNLNKENAISLKYRGEIYKGLIKGLEKRILESSNTSEDKKSTYSEFLGLINEKERDTRPDRYIEKFSPSPSDPQRIRSASKIRASKENRRLDQAVELYNKIYRLYKNNRDVSLLRSSLTSSVTGHRHNSDVSLLRSSLTSSVTRYRRLSYLQFLFGGSPERSQLTPTSHLSYTRFLSEFSPQGAQTSPASKLTPHSGIKFSRLMSGNKSSRSP